MYTWVSMWDIDASVAEVWREISHPEGWSQWWPYVAQVQLLRHGDGDGLGAVRRFVWRTRLPYRICLEVETVEVERERRLVARARGDADGHGIWRLTPIGERTRVEYEWRISLANRWMRWLAPLAAPLFKWNHDGVMRAGGAGLARHLRTAGARR